MADMRKRWAMSVVTEPVVGKRCPAMASAASRAAISRAMFRAMVRPAIRRPCRQEREDVGEAAAAMVIPCFEADHTLQYQGRMHKVIMDRWRERAFRFLAGT